LARISSKLFPPEDGGSKVLRNIQTNQLCYVTLEKSITRAVQIWLCFYLSRFLTVVARDEAFIILWDRNFCFLLIEVGVWCYQLSWCSCFAVVFKCSLQDFSSALETW
jgi:hypothetical protein